MKPPCLLLRASLSVFLCLCTGVYSPASDSSSSSSADTADQCESAQRSAAWAGRGVQRDYPGTAAFVLTHGRHKPEDFGGGSASPAGAQCGGRRLSRTQGQGGQAHGVSGFTETLCGPGEGTGHAGRPRRRDSGIQLRSGGALAGHPRLPPSAGLRKRRRPGDRRSGARVPDD